MNTQKQIFEKLSKQNLVKQNLGAIEDAINEVKDNLLNNLSRIKSNTEALNNITLRLQNQISTILSDYENAFSNVDEQVIDMAVNDMEDLETYGVEVGDFRGIIDEWRDASSNAIDLYNSIPSI